MKKIALYCGFFSLLAVLIGVFPLWGQEFAKHGVQVLDEIVVIATGTEVPLKETSTSTTIINKKQLEARQEPRVEDFLRDVPGAVIMQNGSRGGTTSLFLRGGNSNMNLIMLNGFRLNDTGGAFDLNKLTVDNVNRIEVVRGPMSSLYGNDAMTGVVNLITRQGHGPAKLTATSLWGGHAEGHSKNNLISEQRVSLEGSWKKFSYSMAYGRYDDTGILPINNRFGSNVVNSRFDLEPTDNLKFTLTNYYVDTYFGFPTSSGDRFDAKSFGGNGLDPDQNQKAATMLTGLSGNFRPFPWWENELMLGFQNLDSRYNNPANPDYVTFQTTHYYSRDLEKQWTANYRSNFSFGSKERLASTTTLGVEVRHAQYKGWSYGWDWNVFDYRGAMNKARRGSYTWYLQEQAGAWDRLFLTVGGSLEDNRAFQKLEFCPRASAALRFPETDTTLRAAGGKAVKAPSFTETNSLNPFFLGNPKLMPEKNVSWEVGFDQWLWQNRVQFGLTYFENHFTDLIQYTQTSWTTGSFFNIASARTKGFELYFQGKPCKGFTARTAYTYLTELKVLDDGGLVNINIITGRNLLRRPRQSWNFDLNYIYGPLEVNFHGLYIGAREDRRPDNSAPYYASRVTNGGFFTADLAAYYTVIQKWGYVNRVQLMARGMNLFDKKYEEVFGYSSPRFQIIGGLRLEI
ncbi:MAG: TonB-dependent receptor [Deltaproteobacteria bacterium]|nr:TonB-dependent receptor [Deltaproteobacteria bacterium]